MLQLTDGNFPKIIYIVFIYPYNNGAKYKEPRIDSKRIDTASQYLYKIWK